MSNKKTFRILKAEKKHDSSIVIIQEYKRRGWKTVQEISTFNWEHCMFRSVAQETQRTKQEALQCAIEYATEQVEKMMDEFKTTEIKRFGPTVDDAP